ncbi:hypothetical protein CYL18_01765 [Pradoshia eiseniae]|uniref:TraB/GumN family protein n=1 Tax=Pradoshia eiseniae TaxID=2064768 RepID=A0A2S7N3Q4_9BACI|nr:DUF5694 domain-containing protein [Pradoshia eiseniae]PQD96648.1 hypothetical protein CYL18_01765 [Pradoshia eiseniae]
MGKAKVMILGTFHLRYTPDLYRKEIGGINSIERQQEIRRVIDHVKEFRPTKMAFEVVKSENTRLNTEYERYLKGELKPVVDEVHQFGFPIAAESGHKMVYAVDWMEAVGNRSIGEVYEWAKANQPKLLSFIEETYQKPNNASMEKIDNIYELMQYLNDERVIRLSHESYMALARIGNGENYVGIDWLRWWYQRNLIIYKNLVELIAPDERVVLLIGGSHIHLISQFLKESNLVEVVPASMYLT